MKKGFLSLFRSQKKQKESNNSEQIIKIPIEVYKPLLSITKKQNKTVEEIIEDNPLLFAQTHLKHNRTR